MNNPYVRSIFKQLGTGEVMIPLAVQAAFNLPRSSDPDSAVSVVIIKAVQRGLVRVGYPLQVNGELDEDTMEGLHEVVGSNWRDRTWGDIAKAVLNARGNGHIPTGAIDPSLGSKAGMLLVIGGVLFLALKYKK